MPVDNHAIVMSNKFEKFNNFGLRYLPKDLIQAELWKELEDILTDFDFLIAKCSQNLSKDLIDDFMLSIKNIPYLSPKLSEFASFFQKQAHILRRGCEEWPSHKILLQLAMEYSNDSLVTHEAEKWIFANKCDWIWIKKYKRPQTNPEDKCFRTFEDHSDKIAGAILLSNTLLLSWANKGLFPTGMGGHQDIDIRIWDINSGELVFKLVGHTNRINGVKLISNNRVVSWSDDGTIRIWDFIKGKLISTLKGHDFKIEGTFQLSNNNLCSWSKEKSYLYFWDIESETLLKKEIAHTQTIGGVLEPIGNYFVTWAEDICFWALSSGKLIKRIKLSEAGVERILKMENNQILCFPKENDLFFYSVIDTFKKKVVRTIWPFRNFFSPKNFSEPISEESNVLNLEFLPNLNLLFFHENGNISIFSPEKDKIKYSLSKIFFIFIFYFANLNSLDLKNGPFIGSIFKMIRYTFRLNLFRTSTFKENLVLKGHKDLAKGALLTSDNQILTWSDDKTFRLWDSNSGNLLETFEGHQNGITGVLETPQKQFLSFSMDATLKLWGTTKVLPHKTEAVFESIGHNKSITNITRLPDGRFVTTSFDDTIRFWNCQNDCLGILEGPKEKFTNLLKLSDGTLLSWYSDGAMYFWDSKKYKLLNKYQLDCGIKEIFELFDKNLLIYNDEKELCIFERSTGKIITKFDRKIEMDIFFWVLCLSENRMMTFDDRQAHLWDKKNGIMLEDLSKRFLNLGRLFDPLKPLNMLELPNGFFLTWDAFDLRSIFDETRTTILTKFEEKNISPSIALLLSDTKLLTFSLLDSIVLLWDINSGKCIDTLRVGEVKAESELVSISKKGLIFMDFLFPSKSSLLNICIKDDLLGNTLEISLDNKTVAVWHGSIMIERSIVIPDGSFVATLEGGEFCFLKIYKGFREISILELEKYITEDVEGVKGDNQEKCEEFCRLRTDLKDALLERIKYPL